MTTNNTPGRLQLDVHATDIDQYNIQYKVRTPLSLRERIKIKFGSATVPQTILVGCP